MKQKVIFNFVFLLACLTAIVVTAYSQDKSKELKIGQKFPMEMSLGKVLDSHGNIGSTFQGKKSFKDFKGKLLIFDFWQTWCSSCISHFEYMSELQEKYKDSIQIFLVSPMEDEVAISKWIKQRNAKDVSKLIVPINLPVIADAKELELLFPARGATGYHAWVDGDGELVLRGLAENTHEKKIEEALSGKEISFVQDNALIYNKNTPFFKVQKDVPQKDYITAFCGFTDKLADPFGGSSVFGKIDSTANTIRNSVLNTSIDDFFFEALSRKLPTNTQLISGSRIAYEVKNISLVTRKEPVLNERLTDEIIKKTGYCYEQILPLNIADSVQRKIMHEDIVNYFQAKLGITGGIETRKVEVFKLKISDQGAFNNAVKDGELEKRQKKNVDNRFAYQDMFLRDILRGYLYECDFIKYNDFYFDDTNWHKKISATLRDPNQLKNIEELRDVFKRMGIAIEKSVVPMEFIVIKDVGTNGDQSIGRTPEISYIH